MTIEAVAEKLSFQAEVKQLLKIVVHSLYSNKEIFLRELISNAADASDKLRFFALSHPELYESNSDLNIRITFDNEARTITISDDGIGMSREEVISHIGTIAKSGTLEFLSQLSGDQKKDAHLIGQFGVGFYSAFMVADQVTLITRKAGLPQDQGVRWESKGDGEYYLAQMEKVTHGTDVILHLREGEDEYLNHWRLRHIINQYSDHVNIPIRMLKRTEDDKPTQEWETVNQAKAFWTLPKQTITEQQYKEFYSQHFHDLHEPLAWGHHKIEGNLEYQCLVYIPQEAPFNLWQQEKHSGLKLYVQRVFIMDEVEQFLPHYLRFARGILDTSSIPLNISREILQQHPLMPKIRSALTRHILDLIESIADKQPEKYAKFWQTFGTVLKEGPAEDITNKQRIAKLFRFATTCSVEQESVSFSDYIARMKPGQKKIYYITAESLNAAKASPHLEIFKKNDIEVLLLTDRIDEWFITHLPEYENNQLQSVAKGELQLDELSSNQEEPKPGESRDHQQDYAALFQKIQSILTDTVKEVRLSKRLTASPACLVRDENALGPQMERLLKVAGQPVTEVKPILELNPDHTIIRLLREKSMDDHTLKDWTHILHDQALLAEGGVLSDPATFVNRLNQLWLKMLNT